MSSSIRSDFSRITAVGDNYLGLAQLDGKIICGEEEFPAKFTLLFY
jgi:hypothetical protein